MRLTCCIVLSLAIGVCVGCGRSRTYTGAEGEKATVTQKGDTVEVKVKGKRGEEVRYSSGGAGVALPDGFPKDVAIYPKATVVTSATVEKAMTAMLKTADSAQKAEAFYKDKLKENGWKIESSMNMPQGMMLHGKKESRSLTVVISAEANETMINLTVADEK
jgi:hypothetical protein